MQGNKKTVEALIYKASTSRSGGANPRPFGPEPKIWSVFPLISASFRDLPPTPVFAGFFRLSPGISAYFQTIFKWTFGISQVQPSIATARVAA